MGPLPALVYYRHQIPIVYEGELQREEDVLEWLVANKSTGDEDEVIEDVTAKTLNTLVGSLDNLVVLFCKYFIKFLSRIERIYEKSRRDSVDKL